MKIRYSLILLLAVIITAIAITGFIGTNTIKEQTNEIADRENPKVQASIEMEVEINQITNSIFATMEQRPQRPQFEVNIEDFQRFKEQYSALIQTDEEKVSLNKLDMVFLEYESIGEQLIEVHTEKQNRIEERRDLFNGDIREILLKKLKLRLNPLDPHHDIKAELINEIEINIREIISASRGYLLKPDVFLKDIVVEAISELQHFTGELDKTELTIDEKVQFELLKPDLDELIVLTNEILDFEDRRLSLLEEFDNAQIQLDVVLDDEIQALALEQIRDEDEVRIQTSVEMEVEINDITNSIFAIMEQRPQISPIEKNIEDFQRFKEEYSALIQTDVGRESLAKLDTLFSEYESIGSQLILAHTEKQDRVQERRDLFNGDIKETLLQKLKPGLNPSDVDYDLKSEALNEIEINIHEIISASRGYLLKPDVFLKDITDDGISAIKYFRNQFDNAELTTNERVQFESLKPDLDELIVLTNESLDFEDRRLLLLDDFESYLLQIDDVLDQEIQARTLQKVQDEDEVKIQAAIEMEVEIKQSSNSIFAVMSQRPQFSPIEKNINQFQQFKEKYSSLIRTDIEREQLSKLDTLFSEYESIGSQLILAHTEKQDRVQERRDLFNGDIKETLLQKLKPGLNPSDVNHDLKSEALNEIEINIHEIISASRGYLLKPDVFLKDIVVEAISELQHFTGELDKTELTIDEKVQFESLKPDLDTLVVLTNEILDFEDSRLALLDDFDSILLQIDVVLDDEIQTIALQKIQEDELKAVEAINQLLLSLIVIFIITLVSGFIYSMRIGRRAEKLIEVTSEIEKENYDTCAPSKGSDEIASLGKSINKMAQKLKNTQKEKEEFVAMLTHDLKQPLVPISGNAEMLKNPKMGELNEMQRECVDEITTNANRQLSMIDNLVSAQKIGAGAMEYDIEELSTKDILKEAIKTHTPVMTDKSIEYFDSSTIDVKVKGDNRRIQESFTNLILNSHDFVPENGKIEIGVTDGDKEVTFFVKDNGEGIPKEKQDKLFKKYGQVESSAKRKFGGTGLGLAVSQELVQGMGGKIWLESDIGKGTTFFFTIPKAG